MPIICLRIFQVLFVLEIVDLFCTISLLKYLILALRKSNLLIYLPRAFYFLSFSDLLREIVSHDNLLP